MTDFYTFLSSKDSLDLRKNNTPSDFWIQFHKTYTLDGHWVCALKQISLTCNFTPRTRRLYFCCDIVGESYVRNRTIPVLRNIEIETRYKKLKSETFEEAIYLPVNVSNLNAIRLYLLDEDLQPINFDSNDLHCVLHFKQNGFCGSVRR